jgi:hypothetical protein
MIDEKAQLGDRLRLETVAAMREILTHARSSAEKQENLNSGIWYAQDYCNALIQWKQAKRVEWFKSNKIYQNGYAPTSCFQRKDNTDLHFIAKKTVDASKALANAISGFGIYDCGIVCQIARYRALEKVLGVDRFQRLFDSRVTGAAVNIGYLEDDELQPIRLFVTFPKRDEAMRALATGTLDSMRVRGNLPVKEGQLVYLVGVPEYPYKQPHGPYRSFNLFCSDATQGRQKFIGFGLNPEGVTEHEIYEQMVDAHNKPSKHKKLMTKEEYQAVEDERKRLGYTQYDEHTSNDVLGFMPDSVQDYRVDLIWKLLHTPVEEIKPALQDYYLRERF